MIRIHFIFLPLLALAGFSVGWITNESDGIIMHIEGLRSAMERPALFGCPTNDCDGFALGSYRTDADGNDLTPETHVTCWHDSNEPPLVFMQSRANGR